MIQDFNTEVKNDLPIPAANMRTNLFIYKHIDSEKDESCKGLAVIKIAH